MISKKLINKCTLKEKNQNPVSYGGTLSRSRGDFELYYLNTLVADLEFKPQMFIWKVHNGWISLMDDSRNMSIGKMHFVDNEGHLSIHLKADLIEALYWEWKHSQEDKQPMLPYDVTYATTTAATEAYIKSFDSNIKNLLKGMKR